MLAATVLVATAACTPSSADRSTSANTVRTEPPRTTTTNPYAVPEVIDIAYVTRVLAGLDSAVGDTVRLVMRTRTIPREAYDRLRSIYGNDEALQFAIDLVQNDISKNFAGYSADPGNQVTVISQLITSNSTCIFARVRRDYSAFGPGASVGSDRNWVALRPLDKLRDPDGYNNIGWTFVYEGFPRDRTQPPDPCAN